MIEKNKRGMTLQDIIELKSRVDKNKDRLKKRCLYVNLLSNTMDTLIKTDADSSMIALYLDTMGDFVQNIISVLEEIESESN